MLEVSDLAGVVKAVFGGELVRHLAAGRDKDGELVCEGGGGCGGAGDEESGGGQQLCRHPALSPTAAAAAGQIPRSQRAGTTSLHSHTRPNFKVRLRWRARRRARQHDAARRAPETRTTAAAASGISPHLFTLQPQPCRLTVSAGSA